MLNQFLQNQNLPQDNNASDGGLRIIKPEHYLADVLIRVHTHPRGKIELTIATSIEDAII